MMHMVQADSSMIACPSEEQLAHLLDDSCDLVEFRKTVDHIETCAACQARIKILIGDARWLTAMTVSDRALGAAGREGRTTIQASDETTVDITGWAKDSASPDDHGPRTGSTAGLASGGLDARKVRRLTSHSPLVGSSNFQPASSGEYPFIPGFDVIERLGEGGMGIVYAARQLGLDRIVALKVIRGGALARPQHLARLRIEAEAVARLRHPNIVQIYDIGEADGLPYMVFELLDGGSLDTRLTHAPGPSGFAAELAATLARAVHAAHLAGIIHRDLKPTNVLFTRDAVPKITDFGLAKRLGSDERPTMTGEIMGSPSYLAPEQARGLSREVGPAADVYALGAILYRVLTGQPPFRGGTPLETIRRVIDDDVVPPRRLVPRLNPDLETICLMCLAKEPTKRYNSALALAEDLERFKSGEPVKARRTPVWLQWAKKARRHPAASMLVAIGAAAVLGSAIGGLQYHRSWRDQDRREKARVTALQTAGTADFVRARDAYLRNDLTSARVVLTALQQRVAGEPALRDLAQQVGTLFRQIGDRMAQERAREADRARYEAFRRHRTEALRHDIFFTGLGLQSSRDTTRGAARAALDLFAAPGSGDAWELGALPTSLRPSERAEIAEGCYELLLILAEAEATPDEGLRRSEQAARLRPPTMAYHLRRVACFTRKGDLAAAEKERHQAHERQPSTAFDHFLIGQERLKHQDPKSAIEHFNATLEREPDHFWAQCLSAICALQLPSPGEAKARLNACLQREDRSAWLYVLRGFASAQVADALVDLTKKSPAEDRTLKRQANLQFEAADGDYRRALQLLAQAPSGELHYILLVNRGVLWLKRGDFDRAAGYLQEAIRLNPREVEAIAALAQVYHRQGDADKAFEQYSRAIALNADRAALYRGRAMVELSRKESTKANRARASSDLEQAIRLEEPGSRALARDHTNRARLFVLDHREADALAACEAAIKLVPDSEEAHRLRVEVLLKLNRFADAIRSCDTLISQQKPSASLHELRGLARAGMKDYAGAISDATAALALAPEATRLLSRRGWLYIVSDATRLALHDFEEVLRRDPSTGDAYNGRGFARVRLGEYRQAVADAEKAVCLGRPAARDYYNSARIYAQAAVIAAADVRRTGTVGVAMVKEYQDRAVVLLREALKKLPASERQSFWRDAARNDPALGALGRRVMSEELAAQAEVSSEPRKQSSK
jgi:serine/threonine protein kinase/tetratricopeptide (TPR) repeat protein